VVAIFGLSLGEGEIILILALVLFLFGPRRLIRMGDRLREGNQTLVHAITLVLLAALGFTVLACLR